MLRRSTGTFEYWATRANRSFWIPCFRAGLTGQTKSEMTETLNNAAADPQQTIAELQSRLDESFGRETATAEVMRLINASPSNLAPVFDAILRNAHDLCGAPCGSLQLFVADRVVSVAIRGMSPAFEAYLRRGYPITEGIRERLFVTNPVQRVDIAEMLGNEPDEPRQAAVELGGLRTLAFVPLIKNGKAFGRITAARQEVRPFTEKQISLLQTFADQAAIAIENARLFNETQEALERQTATADILKVIAGSPTDTQPVFDAIAESAKRLIGGRSAVVTRVVGDQLHLVAFTKGSEAGNRTLQSTYPIPLTSPLIHSVVARTGEFAVRTDIENDSDIALEVKELAQARGYRSTITVPLPREGVAIGTIGVARSEAGPFTKEQIDLLRTFADQAVIAIENTRLFNETREALERQTASAEVLQVISSSPGDLKPVFDQMLAKAMSLCEAQCGFIYQMEQGAMRAVAEIGVPPAFAEYRRNNLHTGGAATPADMMRATRKPAHVHDARDSEPYRNGNLNAVAGVDLGGARTVLYVPMIRNDDIVGVINVYRQEVRPFTKEQISLLENFASQAVIAIENARLFNETKEALERQTATADVLKVIASSPSDAQPVFDVIAASANQLMGGYSTTVWRHLDNMVHLAAYTPVNPTADEALRSVPPFLLSSAYHREQVLEGRPIQFDDTENAIPRVAELARARGFRSLLLVPLMSNGRAIGSINVTRAKVGSFAEADVQLLQTFADQAVIAIENAQLFDEVQAKTHELSQSLDDLRTAQDRLVQTEKLASLGQLTAGIAHEIKNPLNFVNNFSALSAELTDELNDVLKPVVMDGKVRADVDELTGLLKDNLEKVVQHGKRADSIVKNMLLHSREGLGEQRSADINALLNESLNLAYHGARAEKPGFNITLRRDLDSDAGAIDVFPQEITRAFINLISNGFYAASKRQAENADPDFEPVLSAVTKNLGNHVEIRIRDNGTGIPVEVKEKIFNPFFTTKPSGEGTGLGLSMSHDIIVKQHGGSIDVETEPGLFTEFKIVLPRANQR
jgi:two-component system NtrC family sensor kinase